MIQPYERALLRSLAGNSPFAQFAQQFKAPTSFPFPVIDTTMSTSASSSSASVNSSTKGSNATPKVYAGYGYRFLRSGEKFTQDSEAVHMLYAGERAASCSSNANRGDQVKDPSSTHLPAGFYRVPTPAPAGFRVLDANEITAKGDRYHGEKEPHDPAVYSNLGKTAEDSVLNYQRHDSGDIFNAHRPTCIIRKQEAEALTPEPTKPTVPSPVDEAIERLQVISERTCRVPKPGDVRAEMNTLVAAVEAPLREQIKDARNGCKRLSETVDRQRTKITDLETKLKQAEDRVSNLHTAFAEKSRALELQLRAQTSNARGNVVILRRDGFSKPMDIAPVGGFSGYELPRYIRFHDMPEPAYHDLNAPLDFAKLSYRTFEAVNTGRKDGFGRTIFEQR